jgi:hypothetical protein
VEKDSVRLKTLITDDFRGTIPTGRTFTKEEYIRYHCLPDVGLLSLDAGNMNSASIRIYGETAIINRVVDVQRKEHDGTVADVKVQRIEVFLKEQDSWKVTAGQGTQVINLPPVED